MNPLDQSRGINRKLLVGGVGLDADHFAYRGARGISGDELNTTGALRVLVAQVVRIGVSCSFRQYPPPTWYRRCPLRRASVWRVPGEVEDRVGRGVA